MTTSKKIQPKPATTPKAVLTRLMRLDKQTMARGPKPSINPDERWPGSLVAFGHAFKQACKSPQPALFIILLYMIAGIFASTTPVPAGADVQTLLRDTLRDASYYSVVNLILLLALPTYALAIADRKEVTLRDIFVPDGRRYLYVLLATVLTSLITLASVFGLLIPVIWWAPWFFFAIYIVADKRTNPIAALRYSRQLARNHKLKFWGLIANVIMLSIIASFFVDIPRVGVALSTLLSAVVSVLFAGASAILYRWLQHQPTK